MKIQLNIDGLEAKEVPGNAFVAGHFLQSPTISYRRTLKSVAHLIIICYPSAAASLRHHEKAGL
jgi:hypothetical protein